MKYQFCVIHTADTADVESPSFPKKSIVYTRPVDTFLTNRRRNYYAIDDCKSTVGVSIGLKRAFDTVDHNYSHKKLEHYGIRGVANKWVSR